MPRYTFEVAYIEKIYRGDAISIEAGSVEEAQNMLKTGEVLLTTHPNNVVDTEIAVEGLYLINVESN